MSHTIEEDAFGLAGWIGQSSGMRAAHRHRDLEVNFVLSGTMTYLVGGRLVELPERRICLLWGGVPHQMILKRQPVEAIWLTIPLATVLRWGLPESLIRPLLGAGLVTDPQPRPSDLDLLHQWLADLPGRVKRPPAGEQHWEAAQRIVLLEIEARLRRLALGLLPGHVSPDRTGGADAASGRGKPSFAGDSEEFPAAAIESMAQFIARNYRSDIGIAEIAAAAHLHPNYAMTLFSRHLGMTLVQYLLLQRVAHAQRLLATTDDDIAAIAAESGFGSISRFYEAFRRQTGNSPRRFRLQMRPASKSEAKA